ncbi:hypothetical protein GALL_348330 [mine drainage metagenome]|uniref:Uncharacterized protein n=1 Tax=mine drainage metagenome TaxID=410659 RepID=A0A1J5QJB9_9ZZZZ
MVVSLRSMNDSVTTYWWLIGMIGMRTSTRRPISGANMPPQLTTISHSMSPLSVCTFLTRPFSVLIARTRVLVKIFTPFWRAPFARACASWEGSTCPSVGRKQAPTTPSVLISGKRSCASLGEISWRFRSKVRAQPIWRRISSIRSFDDASLMLPHSFHVGGVSVSCSSR